MSEGSKQFDWQEMSIFGVALLCLVYGLWGGSLVDSDDAIYADMARNAWRSGDFLDLRWHDAVLFEKPPLLFWILAGFGGILGFHDFAVRLPGALAGLMTVAAVVSLSSAMGANRRTGRLVAAFLLCSYTFVFHSRRVLADPVFVLAMYVFLTGWVRACSEGASAQRRRPRSEIIFAGVALGMCVMIKWVFVVLPLLAVTAWHIVERRKVPWVKAAWVGGVSVAVALPWHVAQSIRHGEAFWQVYAGYHVWERATRDLVSPTGATFYFDILSATDLGFLCLAGVGFVGCALAWRGGNKGALSPWAMVLACYLPLQVSSTKMPHYLLALVPLVALGAARGWWWLIASLRTPAVPVGLALILVMTWVGGPLADILEPDYSPGIKSACQRSGDGAHSVLVMNTYSPAATWYCDKPVTMHTDDPRFYKIQQSVDMMARSRAVKELRASEFSTLALENPHSPVITRPGQGERLRRLLPRAQAGRKVTAVSLSSGIKSNLALILGYPPDSEIIDPLIEPVPAQKKLPHRKTRQSQP